jgi:hypothetical protein
MLQNLKLIFIHGIDNQTTNYSQGLYLKILSAGRAMLKARGQTDTAIDRQLNRVVHHEVLWADLTTDLTDRYLQLAYQHPHWFWGHFTRAVDPLGLQIMHYIKDKGDKPTGPMNILREVDHDIQRILSTADIGVDPSPKDGQNTIIVSHSLGSVIAFDYVMGFRPPLRLDPAVTVKSFITMGSPLPLFTSAMGYPDSDFALPENVHRWVNIASPRDGIARPMQPFFHNIAIDERTVATKFSPLAAHTAYWRDHQTAQIIAYEVLKALNHDK